MKEFRPAIIRMHERGVEKREIGRLLGIHEATTAQERLEPPRLQRMEHFGGESVFETPSDCRIVEASIEEGME
uniref:Transposase n=1 Tax=Acrobeloides nanus TaxID=290746 RepID=A0A914DX00_9BILA